MVDPNRLFVEAFFTRQHPSVEEGNQEVVADCQVLLRKFPGGEFTFIDRTSTVRDIVELSIEVFGAASGARLIFWAPDVATVLRAAVRATGGDS